MHSLLIEQSDENVRLDSIDAVKRAAAASKERAVVVHTEMGNSKRAIDRFREAKNQIREK